MTHYLLGDASDTANWGDPARTKGGVWAPLERVVAPRYRANFMFMETVRARVGDGERDISLYKHDMTREYVNVDAAGQLYAWAGEDRYTLLALDTARLRLVGGLVMALENGVDISRDMRQAYAMLAARTGLQIRQRR